MIQKKYKDAMKQILYNEKNLTEAGKVEVRSLIIIYYNKIMKKSF